MALPAATDHGEGDVLRHTQLVAEALVRDERGRLDPEDRGVLWLATLHPFASDHARCSSFARPGRDPAYAPHDDTRSRAVVLSGLPGAGKDHWIATHHEGRPTIALLADSRAHVTIVAVAAPRHELRRRNQERRRPGRVEV